MIARLAAVLLAAAATGDQAAPPDCEALAVAAANAGDDPATRSKAWVAAGWCFAEANVPLRAIESFELALALVPDQPDVLGAEGVMYARVKDRAQAIEKLERAIALRPGDETNWYNLAALLDRAKHFKRAAAAWRKVVELAPKSGDAEDAREALDRLEQRCFDEESLAATDSVQKAHAVLVERMTAIRAGVFERMRSEAKKRPSARDAQALLEKRQRAYDGSDYKFAPMPFDAPLAQAITAYLADSGQAVPIDQVVCPTGMEPAVIPGPDGKPTVACRRGDRSAVPLSYMEHTVGEDKAGWSDPGTYSVICVMLDRDTQRRRALEGPAPEAGAFTYALARLCTHDRLVQSASSVEPVFEILDRTSGTAEWLAPDAYFKRDCAR